MTTKTTQGEPQQIDRKQRKNYIYNRIADPK